MSLADDVKSMYTHTKDVYDSLEKLGATLPSEKNLANLVATFDTIPLKTPLPPMYDGDNFLRLTMTDGNHYIVNDMKTAYNILGAGQTFYINSGVIVEETGAAPTSATAKSSAVTKVEVGRKLKVFSGQGDATGTNLGCTQTLSPTYFTALTEIVACPDNVTTFSSHFSPLRTMTSDIVIPSSVTRIGCSNGTTAFFDDLSTKGWNGVLFLMCPPTVFQASSSISSVAIANPFVMFANSAEAATIKISGDYAKEWQQAFPNGSTTDNRYHRNLVIV